jgi:hypothetical protein
MMMKDSFAKVQDEKGERSMPSLDYLHNLTRQMTQLDVQAPSRYTSPQLDLLMQPA